MAYTIVAFIVWLQYMSIGEMTAYRPVHGGFIRQEAEYVDKVGIRPGEMWRVN